MHFGRFVHDGRDSDDCSSDKNETACRTSVHSMAGFNKKMLQAFVKSIIKCDLRKTDILWITDRSYFHSRYIELGFPSRYISEHRNLN
jgi:hypothetical protein